MPTTVEELNDEQMVTGAVENALNEYTNNDLNFPENFPTDAPGAQNMEGQQPEYDHEHQQYEISAEEQQQYGEPPEAPVAEVVEAYMKTTNSKKKKIKSTKNTGRWTEDEHYKFLQGVSQHGKDCNKIAAMIPSRTTLQVRTHAQKYFQKMEKPAAAPTGEGAEAGAVQQLGNGITSPIAAQTLLGMSQLNSQQQPKQRSAGTKRKLDMTGGGGKSSKKKPSNRCQYRDCKARLYKQTRACFKHQNMLCTYPDCESFVEEDTRFSQKRELCRTHYSMLINRPRSMYEKRSDRP